MNIFADFNARIIKAVEALELKDKDGGMPDLSKMDPKQMEALARQAEAAGLTKGGGLPGLPGGGLPGLGGPKLPGLGGGIGGLPGLPKKK